MRPATQSRLCISASGDRHRPIIFRDAGPEDPYHDYGSECEEGFEEGAVYLAGRGVADMSADYVLEDLANGK